jgi:hypothetical protein
MDQEELSRYKMKPGFYSNNTQMSPEALRAEPVVGAGRLPESIDWRAHGAVNPIKNQA